MPPPFPIFSRAEAPIRDLNEWEALAGPAADYHWKPGYSACELARTWLTDQGLTALRAVLDLVPATRDFAPERGTAEAQTRFDSFRGPRNHDLLLSGEASNGATVVAIEGKVNEPFGQTLAEYRADALAKAAGDKPTKAPERLTGLTRALAGWELSDDDLDPRGLLRYQLFSAIAGTVAAAVDAQAKQAVFCVHELQTNHSDDRAMAVNAADLKRFVAVVFPDAPGHDGGDGWIAGPLTVVAPTKRLSADVPFYIAKVHTAGI